MEQRSLEKALKLIGYLSGNNGYTVSQLASFLMTTKRTIYRYFDTLRECGYVLIKNRASVYYISEAKENLPNYIRLVMLSDEEACVLNRLLDMLADTNPLKSELRRKLSGLSEMDHWEDYSVSQKHARNIEILGYAIRMKQKVVLRGYGSSHSGTIRDWVVEPYRILEDGAYITAYDCHSSSCRVFKVMRMKSVDLTGSQWESEHLHEDMYIDVFRMSGVPRYSVTILLTLRARNLMIEEFPLSRKHIRWYAKRMWRFHAQVCALEGIGRFVLGLPEDVQIVASPELKAYIQEKISYTVAHVK